MAFSGQLRTNRATAFVVGVVIFLVAIIGLAYNHLDDWQQPPNKNQAGSVDDTSNIDVPKTNPSPDADVVPPPPPPPSPPPPATDLASVYFEHIRKPTVKPDARSYHPFAGAMHWELPEGEAKWTQPLAEDFCIIDMDNRPFNESGQVFSDGEPMSWDRADKVHGLSTGVLNHWVYAKIHGYKYYYIDFETYEDRRASWKKPPIMSKILKKHKACVYLDSDAIFNQLELPFEWLMNYWSLAPDNNSLALAYDPGSNNNKDKFGKVYLNTGFIVAQNNPTMFEIMDAWQKVPPDDDNTKHPECKDFRFARPGKPTDQGGFGTFIRYDYENDIKSLPCDEANGFSESGSGCAGHFIKHLWTGKKNWIKAAIGNQLPGDMLETMHKKFLEDAKNFRMTEAALMMTKD